MEKRGDGLVLACRRVDGNAQWVGEGCALERFDFGGHCRGEEICFASFAREGFENFIKDRAKVQVEESVGFVHDQVFQVAQGETFCVFEVVEKATRCCNDNVRVLAQSDCLTDHIHTADNDCRVDANDGP